MLRLQLHPVAAPRPLRKGRRGFTLVEGLIAVVLGAIIFGGAMSMLSFGNRAFTKTTEHSAFRAEAMVMIEKVGEDIAALVVSPEGPNPAHPSGELSILSPVVYSGNEVTYEIEDPSNPGNMISLNNTAGLSASDGITFFRYDRIEMVNDPSNPDTPPGGMPTIIARKVVYETRDNPGGGKDLYRNDVKLNKQVLDQVVFHSELPIVTAHQVKGSPHAIVTVKIVPKGGLRGDHFGSTNRAMSEKIIEALRNRAALVEKTFHLVEYESMYTTYLYSALSYIQQFFANNNIDFTSDNIQSRYADALVNYEFEKAVFEDAYLDPVNAAPQELRERIQAAMAGGTSMVTVRPKAMFQLEDVPYDPRAQTALSDALWQAAPMLGSEQESVSQMESQEQSTETSGTPE